MLLRELNAELAGVVDRVRASVVEVRDGQHGAGAGTIWHPDGLIVTNSHVARRGSAEIRLTDGRTLRAQVIARDDARDLAALALDVAPGGLPVIEPGSGRALKPGQWVFAVGHPWGIHHAATGGVIIGRSDGIPDLPHTRNDWVVVDLQLRPGNSGGPLVDTLGRLVGVNTMMTGPNVGMAISVDAVRSFLRDRIGNGVSGATTSVV